MSAPDPYAYNPYGSPYSAAPPEPEPAAPKPRLLVVAPVLMVLASLPFLLFGTLFVAAPVDAIAQDVVASPNMQAVGVSGGAVDTITLACGLLVLILGAVAILFSPRVNAWYAARR